MTSVDRTEELAAQHADAILHRSRRRIEIFVEAGDDWRFAESLKSISEDTAQEYEGRALFELLQNGYDALGEGGHGRVRIVLDCRAGEYGTLYVANEGKPFAESNFKAITEFGLSDKGAGEGIGNKGLGFRSVLQLTDWPEIYSKGISESTHFTGYCFRFATPDDVKELVTDPDLAREVAEKVPALALPVPAEVSDARVRALGAEGFSTVVRVPLRNERARDAAVEQLEALAEYQVPVLLFLDRLTSVDIECESDEPWRHVLHRSEGPFEPLGETPWLTEVGLGDEGRFLRATRAVPVEELKSAVEASIAAREIDEKWRDWDGEAAVSIALGLHGSADPGRLYTFLPMSEAAVAPFRGHAHAPFFTKLARLDISESVALNDYLVGRLAALARDVLRELTTLDPSQLPSGITVDLACWSPPDRMQQAFDEVGRLVLSEPFVPVNGKDRWGTLNDSFQWPHTATAVVTTSALTRLGVKVVDDTVGYQHRARLEQFHEALVGRSMAPQPEEAAEWVERTAARLQRERASFTRWADFYDDLAVIFGGSATALAGRAIILDQDGQLTRALGGDEVSKQTVFFAPDEASSDETASRLPRDLRALRRRIAFTHPDLPWTLPGNPPRRRPGRVFLEPVLVREYRTDRVFEAIDELLQHKQTDAFRRDALIFAYRQFATLNESQREQLRRYHFFVPVSDGSWGRATDALFHPDWSTDAASRMDRFLSNGGDSIPEFARLRLRWIAGAPDWPDQIDDQPQWETFLISLGVRDGLLLFVLDARRPEREGNAMRPERLAVQFKLDETLGREWSALVRRTWSDFAHPWTRYAFDQPLAHLPGAEALQRLGARARQEFAELVLLALPAWADRNFVVRVRRPTRPISQQDPHNWPTPLATQLRSLAWLPLADESAPDGLRFAPPNEVWFASEGDLPAFMPSLPSSTRRLLLNETALRRVKDAGLRVWEDGRNGPELVRDLGQLLDAAAVPGHLTVHFKKHYERGWAETVRTGRWPWTDGERAPLAVTEMSSLAIWDDGADLPLFVPDEENHFKESLLDLAGYPVLVAATEDGARLRALFEANGFEVRGFTDTEVKIEADGSVVSASPEPPLLVDTAPWLPTLVGLVLELKSGEFRRRSERTVRDLMDRVRSVRLARASFVNVVIEGESAETPAATKGLPVDDAKDPTIVVWDVERGWAELRAASPSICQLLSQPAIQPALELALVKLQGRCVDGVPAEVDDDDLALALDAPVHKVAELRRSLTGELVELVHRLRPVLVCVLGVARQDEVNRCLQRVAEVEALRGALEAWEKDLPTPVNDLIAAARRAASLTELRDLMGLDFESFNDALALLGSPYRVITHPDLHEQVFSAFVATHEALIVDLLREKYAVQAAAGEDLRAYVAARRLDGLEADSEWLRRYEVPPESEMRRVVGSWLGSHGVTGGLNATPDVPDLADLRRANVSKVDDVVESGRLRVVAWCHKNDHTVPVGWSSVPGMTVRGLIEGEGIADLLVFSEDWILERSAKELGWPEGMATTLALEVLGLSAADLARPADESADEKSTRRASTIDVGGRTFEVGTDRLTEIARAAHESVDEEFLAQKGTASLGDAPLGSGGGGGGGGRIVVARMPRMTEDQRTAVGLVGEVAARAWLERRYQGVRWRSGYAAIVAGDIEASDSWGYDFEAPYRNTSLVFEVKSLVDQPRDLTEFEMGDSEVRAAQECAGGDRYRILLVTSVLEPEARRVFVLPSPFSKKGAGRFRVVGRGLRYRFRLT